MQSRETQITMVKWTNTGGQTKRANEQSFVYPPPAWRWWHNVKTTYTRPFLFHSFESLWYFWPWDSNSRIFSLVRYVSTRGYVIISWSQLIFLEYPFFKYFKLFINPAPDHGVESILARWASIAAKMNIQGMLLWLDISRRIFLMSPH